MAKDNENHKHPALSPLHKGRIVTIIIVSLIVVFAVAAFDATMFSNIVTSIF